jgi:hypothetical protein
MLMWIVCAFYAYLMWHKISAARHKQVNNVYTQLVSAILQLRPVVGNDVNSAQEVIDEFVKRPNVTTRNTLLNLVSSWTMRSCDTQSARDQITAVLRLADKWTRSNLNANDTQYDAPRAYGKYHQNSTYFLYV